MRASATPVPPGGMPAADDELLEDSWGSSLAMSPGQELAAVVSQSDDDTAGSGSREDAATGKGTRTQGSGPDAAAGSTTVNDTPSRQESTQAAEKQ